MEDLGMSDNRYVCDSKRSSYNSFHSAIAYPFLLHFRQHAVGPLYACGSSRVCGSESTVTCMEQTAHVLPVNRFLQSLAPSQHGALITNAGALSATS